MTFPPFNTDEFFDDGFDLKQALSRSAQHKPVVKLPIEEARQATAKAIRDAFDFAALRQDSIEAGMDAPLPWYPDRLGILPDIQKLPPATLLRVGLGIGKTTSAISIAVDAIKQGKFKNAIYFAVPTHALGEQVSAKVQLQAEAAGVDFDAFAWRGRDAKNPNGEGHMCTYNKVAEFVFSLGLDVGKTLCDKCPLKDSCDYLLQNKRAKKAKLVIIPHTMLKLPKPSGLPRADMLIVDEDASLQMLDIGETASSIRIELRDILKNNKGGVLSHPEPEAYLYTTLMNLPDGNVPAGSVSGFSGNAEEAIAAAWRRVDEDAELGDVIGSFNEIRRNVLRAKIAGQYTYRHGAHMARLWQIIAEAKAMRPDDKMGRLFIYTSESGRRFVSLRGVDDLADWLSATPRIHMDGTAEPQILNAIFGPHIRHDIVATAPHKRTHKVIGKTFSHASISPSAADGDDEPPDGPKKPTRAQKGARRVLARIIEVSMAEGYDRHPEGVLAVVPKGTREYWKTNCNVPNWLHVEHLGNVAGLDTYGSVRAEFVVGRLHISHLVAEAMAFAVTGLVEELEEDPAVAELRRSGIIHLADMKEDIIRTAEGEFKVTRPGSNDPLADAFIRHSRNSHTAQANRERGVNRSAETPVDVYLWSDAEILMDDDATVEGYTAPSLDAEAYALGCWVDSAVDMARLWPELGSETYAKKARSRKQEQGDIPLIYTLNISEMSPCSVNGAIQFRYRRAKADRAPTRGIMTKPMRLSDVRGWLEERVGPLAYLEIDGMPEADAVQIEALQAEAEGRSIEKWNDAFDEWLS